MEHGPPVGMEEERSDNIREQSEGQPFQDARDLLIVTLDASDSDNNSEQRDGHAGV